MIWLAGWLTESSPDRFQREEAEARALEEAEEQRQERERIIQQNQQERMQRRKARDQR